jgi:transposase InsO family protein
VPPDEKVTTAIAFLRRAVAFYTAHGVTVLRVMTDDGPAYLSTIHAFTCRVLNLRHVRTRPYRPRTYGKAERFIRSSSPAGPTARSTAQAQNAPQPSTAGCGPTTSGAHTAPSHTSPRSLSSTS